MRTSIQGDVTLRFRDTPDALQRGGILNQVTPTRQAVNAGNRARCLSHLHPPRR